MTRKQPSATLVDTIESLQIGILISLMSHYRTRRKGEEALQLANCVLTYAMCVEPTNEESRSYLQSHKEMVLSEASLLKGNSVITPALSNLYAALIIHAAINTANPISPAAALLSQRATDLSITIPNTYDICGTNDPAKCIEALSSFSEHFKQQITER